MSEHQDLVEKGAKFSHLTDGEIEKVAQEYAKAVREAKQMDITAQSPEQFATRPGLRLTQPPLQRC